MAIVYLQLQNVTKAFGDEEILNDISLQVREGECFGLIGPNGAGKSTLFRIINGQETADHGEVVVPRGIRVGYLTQDAEVAAGSTVLAELLASRDDITDIATRMRELEQAMSAPGANDDIEAFDRLLHEHARLAEDFHRLGGDTLQQDALRILRGLGLDETFDAAEVATLSGGQKRRLALAKLLLASPDLMLLDEPTNHLDLAAINWLEEYLRAYRGGVLIVSHDRYLLDRVANHIAEVEETRLRQFDGNYTAYQEKKTAENAMLVKRSETIARERARLQESVQRLFSFRQFTRMRSLQKQLYRLEQITLPGEAEKSRMVFKPSRESGREVLTVENLRKRFTDNPLLENITFTLWRKDRAALIGPNGCGKTTLLRMLVDEMPAEAGTAHFGHQVNWYYYDQEGRNLDARLTVLQEVARINPHLSQSEIRGALARFLIFGEDVERPVSTLSGGERSRVSLTKMFLSGANLLILDEPTNHLDIDGKEALEEALADYTGTVLMVSHDRYFIDRVANRVLEVDNGAICDYLGNYTDFIAKKEERAQQAAAEAAAQAELAKRQAAKKTTTVAEPHKRRSLQYLQRQQEQNEQLIEQLELRKGELEELLADPSLYTDGIRAKQVTEEHQKLLSDIDDAYAEWETVAEDIMALELEAEEARQERLAKR
ncbi:MAG TPA: ABC-F family ATP-binding cassette domain-containing protein [Armatimonadota bacterium]|nr:ABC-F family ATP-binding cassette domain-containing protein [Armatimonadota bacterium]